MDKKYCVKTEKVSIISTIQVCVRLERSASNGQYNKI